MLVWLYASRGAAMRAAGISLKGRVGTRGDALDGRIPDRAQWKSHNYSHLTEQPTLFYAVALALAVAGLGAGLNATLAWIYVALRIVHSLVQVTTNVVLIRFAVFSLSSLVLIVLAIRAALVLVF